MRFQLALSIGSRILGVIADRLEKGDAEDQERAVAVRMAQEIIDSILAGN